MLLSYPGRTTFLFLSGSMPVVIGIVNYTLTRRPYVLDRAGALSSPRHLRYLELWGLNPYQMLAILCHAIPMLLWGFTGYCRTFHIDNLRNIAPFLPETVLSHFSDPDRREWAKIIVPAGSNELTIFIVLCSIVTIALYSLVIGNVIAGACLKQETSPIESSYPEKADEEAKVAAFN